MMKRINLLLPFTHGVDMRAIEQALLLAKGRQATLVPLALIHVPEERRAKGARLEHVQQSKDFLEAVKHKAARYAVPIERFEVFTGDVVQSINTIASDLECEGILLFVGRKDGILLQASEIKHLMETTTCRLYILRLQTGDGESVVQKLLKGFSRWLSLSRKQRARLAPVQESSEEEVTFPMGTR
jgi:universal stress protein family protein